MRGKMPSGDHMAEMMAKMSEMMEMMASMMGKGDNAEKGMGKDMPPQKMGERKDMTLGDAHAVMQKKGKMGR